jgi:hypothetical protein
MTIAGQKRQVFADISLSRQAYSSVRLTIGFHSHISPEWPVWRASPANSSNLSDCAIKKACRFGIGPHCAEERAMLHYAFRRPARLQAI